MSKLWLTIPEIEEITKIPDRTIRRYLSAHGIHLQIRKVHRNYLVHSDSVPVITKIRDLYSIPGWDSNKVENALAESGTPVVIQADDNNDRQVIASQAEAYLQLENRLTVAVTAMAAMAENQQRMDGKLDQIISELAKERNARMLAEKERDRLAEQLAEQTKQELEKINQIQQSNAELVRSDMETFRTHMAFDVDEVKSLVEKVNESAEEIKKEWAVLKEAQTVQKKEYPKWMFWKS